MLNDITRHDGDNLGGVNAFKFIPAKGLNPLPARLNGCINHQVSIKDGYRWYTGYCTEFTMNYKESPTQSEHGIAYKKTFSGKTPNDRPDLTWLFDEMKDQGFVLDIIDNNGMRKLVGSPDEPVYFVASLDTKSEMAQRNEHEIVFEGEGIDKSPFYNI